MLCCARTCCPAPGNGSACSADPSQVTICSSVCLVTCVECFLTPTTLLSHLVRHCSDVASYVASATHCRKARGATALQHATECSDTGCPGVRSLPAVQSNRIEIHVVLCAFLHCTAETQEAPEHCSTLLKRLPRSQIYASDSVKQYRDPCDFMCGFCIALQKSKRRRSTAVHC